MGRECVIEDAVFPDQSESGGEKIGFSSESEPQCQGRERADLRAGPYLEGITHIFIDLNGKEDSLKWFVTEACSHDLRQGLFTLSDPALKEV